MPNKSFRPQSVNRGSVYGFRRFMATSFTYSLSYDNSCTQNQVVVATPVLAVNDNSFIGAADVLNPRALCGRSFRVLATLLRSMRAQRVKAKQTCFSL